MERGANTGGPRTDDDGRASHGVQVPGGSDLPELIRQQPRCLKATTWLTSIATFFESLLSVMAADSAKAAPNLQYVLASRHLERIADHATNIAEDVLLGARTGSSTRPGEESRNSRGRRDSAGATR